jgi:hypothetical protein
MKKWIALTLLALIVVSTGLIVKELANIHISIVGSNASVQRIDFSFEGLVSGDEFNDTQTTIMIVTGIREPYIKIYPESLANSSYFDYLWLNISVNGNEGSIDLLNGGQYAVEVSSTTAIELTVHGKVSFVTENVTIDLPVVVEVNSGPMQVTGNIQGTIVGG